MNNIQDINESIRKQAKNIAAFARAKPLGAAGGLLVLAFVLVAIFAPLLVPYEPNAQVLSERLQAPTLSHIMGTDDYGRDVFSRIVSEVPIRRLIYPSGLQYLGWVREALLQDLGNL